jgi:hypothetical protein
MAYLDNFKIGNVVFDAFNGMVVKIININVDMVTFELRVQANRKVIVENIVGRSYTVYNGSYGCRWELQQPPKTPDETFQESLAKLEQTIQEASQKIVELKEQRAKELRKASVKFVAGQLYKIDKDIEFCKSVHEDYVEMIDTDSVIYHFSKDNTENYTIKHLNKTNQEKMAKVLSEFFSGNIPKD